MSSINPENQCSHLVETEEVKFPTIEEMFQMQLDLQNNLKERGKGFNYDSPNFEERVKEVLYQFTCMTMEQAELIERLPWKSWKTYSEDDKLGWKDDKQRLEVLFEYIDIFHFFMNIGLLLGIDGKEFSKLYYLKNKENFRRQENNY